MRVLYSTAVILSIAVISCNTNSQMKLDRNNAVGLYESNNKGYESLALRIDSTYVYKTELDGDSFEFSGRWKFEKVAGDPWIEARILFYDWPVEIDPFYSNSKLQFSNEELKDAKDEREPVYLDFLISGIFPKKKYTLRRNFDLQEEFDFIKIDK